MPPRISAATVDAFQTCLCERDFRNWKCCHEPFRVGASPLMLDFVGTSPPGDLEEEEEEDEVGQEEEERLLPV